MKMDRFLFSVILLIVSADVFASDAQAKNAAVLTDIARLVRDNGMVANDPIAEILVEAARENEKCFAVPTARIDPMEITQALKNIERSARDRGRGTFAQVVYSPGSIVLIIALCIAILYLSNRKK
jgi:hypothetical protein